MQFLAMEKLRSCINSLTVSELIQLAELELAYALAQLEQTPTRNAFAKVDWSFAPYWAKYHAFDASGNGYWYSFKPEPQNGVVWSYDPRLNYDLGSLYRGSSFSMPVPTARAMWRESLTERPTV